MIGDRQHATTTNDTMPRIVGFDPDSTVDVRQFDEQTWTILRPFTYHGTMENFEVPAQGRTDFASVPRVFVWFLPRYGRYTRAAILHDYLWSVAVPAGRVTRLDADGIFRAAMRELGVPFLRRWIMWAAVRWGALAKPDGRRGWWKEAWSGAYDDRTIVARAKSVEAVAAGQHIRLRTVPAAIPALVRVIAGAAQTS
jgi:Protein of unknown function (DUF1353)